MRIKEIAYKISESPSRSAMAWIGAFILGIGAATCFFPVRERLLALPAAVSCALSALASGIIIKNKKVRLLAIAGFCFCGGFFRYLSAGADPIDLLRYFPVLAGAKSWLIASVGRILPEPQAGFLDGLLVGGGTRSPELKAAFIATGTAHVMALSGYNVTIVSRWLDRALAAARLGRKARWTIGLLGLAAFTVMTGAGASLVRAAVMAALSTAALACGRRSVQGRLVVYAAALMLAVSPALLRTDVGFLLSVAAMLGLIFLAPILEPLVRFLPRRFGIAKTCAETAAATLATLPVCLAAFGQISFIALPSNLLLLPFIPYSMGVGLAGAAVSGALPFMTASVRPFVSVFADYDVSLVKLLARLPGASVSNVAFGPIAASVMSAGLIIVAAKHHARRVQEKAA